MGKFKICVCCDKWIECPTGLGLCREKLEEEEIPSGPFPELNDWCSHFETRTFHIVLEIVADPSVPRMPPEVIGWFEELKRERGMA